MDIVDAQVHVGRGKIDSTLEAMDALGIASVIIDELWDAVPATGPTHFSPGHLLANGAWRVAWPTAEEASLLHPERFSYLVRIDRLDPELESFMRFVGSAPNAVAFRLLPVWTLDEAKIFSRGGYEPLLDLADDIGLAVSLFIPGQVELLRPYLERYPKLDFVVDHCGMGFPDMPAGRKQSEIQHARSTAYFDEVLKLAEFPNVALKWSHAQNFFGAERYPYQALQPVLRRAIEAFGADRLIWASDKSVMHGHTWSDLLNYLRDSTELSGEEKSWILGGSARRWFNWPMANA